MHAVALCWQLLAFNDFKASRAIPHANERHERPTSPASAGHRLQDAPCTRLPMSSGFHYPGHELDPLSGAGIRGIQVALLVLCIRFRRGSSLRAGKVEGLLSLWSRDGKVKCNRRSRPRRQGEVGWAGQNVSSPDGGLRTQPQANTTSRAALCLSRSSTPSHLGHQVSSTASSRPRRKRNSVIVRASFAFFHAGVYEKCRLQLQTSVLNVCSGCPQS